VSRNPDDRSLVARARQGDTTAFEQLVHRYSGPSYRIALRIVGDGQTADDAAQEAFIVAWRQLTAVRAGQAFSAWLFRIVTTRALNIVRARKPDVPIDVTAPPPDAKAGPEAEAIAADLRAALASALGTLTPPQRASWVLKELEGCSYDQIAEITHASPDAVRGRIYRARAGLAEELASWR
jgi:RNA polymerase sigma-70 factor (ECF subfamily)